MFQQKEELFSTLFKTKSNNKIILKRDVNRILNKEENKELNENIIVSTAFLNKNENINVCERIFCIMNDITNILVCPICKLNKLSFNGYSIGYSKTCSKKCGLKIQKQTNLLKYGKEYALQNNQVKEKQKKTILNRYGVENIFQNEEIKENIKQTNIQRYGVENVFQNKEIKEKIKQTTLKKYGKEHYLQNESIIKQLKEKSLEKNGYEHISQKNMLNYELFNVNYILNNFVSIKYSKNNKSRKLLNKQAVLDFFNIKINMLNKFIRKNKKYFVGIRLSNFNMELELKNKIIEIANGLLKEEDIILNDRNVLGNGKELDLYIPKLNIAMEYNGLMFHSFGMHSKTRFNNYEKEKVEKYKHLIKTNLCEEKGIHLFQINEDEWLDSKKKKIWLNILKNKIIKKNNELILVYNLDKLNYKIDNELILKNDLFNCKFKELFLEENIKEKQIVLEFLNNNSLEYNSNNFNVDNNINGLDNNKQMKYIGLFNIKENNKKVKENGVPNELIALLYGYFDKDNKLFNIIEICVDIDIGSKLSNIQNGSFFNEDESLIYMIKKELIEGLLNNIKNIDSQEKLKKIIFKLNRRIYSKLEIELLKKNMFGKYFNNIRITNKPNFKYFKIEKGKKVIYEKNVILKDKRNMNKEYDELNNLNISLYNKLSKTLKLYNLGFRRFYDCGDIVFSFEI